MKRNGFQIMTRLTGLVRPLIGYMALAVVMGLVGHLCASFITIFGGYAALGIIGYKIPLSLRFIFYLLDCFCIAPGISSICRTVL